MSEVKENASVGKKKMFRCLLIRNMSTSLLHLSKESTGITGTTSASLALFLCIHDTLILKLLHCSKINTLDCLKMIWNMP